MRPCQSCNAAIENHQTACPECGADASERPRVCPAPPPSQELLDQRERGTKRVMSAHLVVLGWLAVAFFGLTFGLSHTKIYVALAVVPIVGAAFHVLRR